MPALIAAIEEYLVARSQDPKPFVWTACVASILAKPRDCMATSETSTGGLRDESTTR